MATYSKPGDQLADGVGFTIDVPLLNDSNVLSAQIGVVRGNVPNIPVEIGVSNLSQQISVGRLAFGNVWRGQLFGKVFWEGKKRIPKHEEYVMRFTGRNDSGAAIDLAVTVVDDSD